LKVWIENIENLESGHRGVSKSHRVIPRSRAAFDPPIDASGLDGVLYRAGPLSRPQLFSWTFFAAAGPGGQDRSPRGL
jgi:hypothetical protein